MTRRNPQKYRLLKHKSCDDVMHRQDLKHGNGQNSIILLLGENHLKLALNLCGNEKIAK